MFREEEKTVFLVFSDFAIDHGSSQSLEWREAFSSWVVSYQGSMISQASRSTVTQ